MFTDRRAKSQYSEWNAIKARDIQNNPLTLKDFEIYILNGNPAGIAIVAELMKDKTKIYLTQNMIAQLQGLSRDECNVIRTGGVKIMFTFTKSKNGREYGRIVDAPEG